MTYGQWLQCLTEAEDRAANSPREQVRANSRETAALILDRLASEGITRDELKKLAKTND